MRTTVVIPTIRKLDCLEQWRGEFDSPNVRVIVVEDHDKREISIPEYVAKNIEVYSRKEIKKELGDKAWIIPKFSSACRSFGIWKAWQGRPDMIVTLDDDCYPERPDYFLKEHWIALNGKVTLGWETSVPRGAGPEDFIPRGVPYQMRGVCSVALSHGLWSGTPDMDAPTQLVRPYKMDPVYTQKVIRWHNFFPMCGMNMAWRPEISRLLYFGLQGKEWEFNQFDDIWAGIFAKKILDYQFLAVVSGRPSVRHIRASDVYKNLQAQASGIRVNEKLWQWVAEAPVTDKLDELVSWVTIGLIADFPEYKSYFNKMEEATKIWTSLFA